MIKMHCTFFSKCLGRDAEMIVLLPAKAVAQGKKEYKTLYLLHGLMDQADRWINRSSLERYASKYSMAIILPNAARSFYTDMVYGDKYYTHISQEVPQFCESVFPLSRDPEKRFIAGMSMGGYGACKIALKEPGRFSKVGIISGVMDIQQMVKEMPVFKRDWFLCFGGNQVPESEDLPKLMPKVQQFPRFYQYCGTADPTLEGNRLFCDLCHERGISITSTWEEEGTHDWHYWDKQLPELLAWMESEN